MSLPSNLRPRLRPKRMTLKVPRRRRERMVRRTRKRLKNRKGIRRSRCRSRIERDGYWRSWMWPSDRSGLDPMQLVIVMTSRYDSHLGYMCICEDTAKYDLAIYVGYRLSFRGRARRIQRSSRLPRRARQRCSSTQRHPQHRHWSSCWQRWSSQSPQLTKLPYPFPSLTSPLP